MAIAIKLSESWQDGLFKCFRKTVGGKEFYFNRDRGQSERAALALTAAWSRLKTSGVTDWNDNDIAIAMVLAGIQKQAEAKQPAARQVLYAAVDAYLDDYKARVSPSRYQRERTALATYKQHQGDAALKAIGWNQLHSAVTHFRGRPKTATGMPMAVATVRTTTKAIKSLFDWLDNSGKWEAPRRFDRIFRVNYDALRTPLEVKADGNGVATFTVAELVTLYKAATPRQRLYIALALNTGETSQGIADLMKGDIIGQSGKLTIDRHRGKTGVRGVYPLWPEVAAMVRQQMNAELAEPLAFKSGDGNPLVWYHATGRVDSIAKTWANLLKKCPTVRSMGFSYLRKTGASLIEQLTGSLYTSQIYLSHKGGSVAEKHYLARNFDQLAAALIQMHNHLRPMFNVDPRDEQQAAHATLQVA